MFLLGNWIKTDKARTYWTFEMDWPYLNGRRGGSMMSSLEFKTRDDALLALLEWLIECDMNNSNPSGRLYQIKTHKDGSVTFKQDDWFPTYRYMLDNEYGPDSVVAGMRRRREALDELRTSRREEVTCQRSL